MAHDEPDGADRPEDLPMNVRGRSRKRPGMLLPAIVLLAAAHISGCGRIPRIVVLSDPLSAKEHLELGVSYERRGELDLAVREYERALRKDRALLQARINLGNVRLAKGEFPEAKKEYRKALSLSPGHPEAANNLAWAAIGSGTGLEEAADRLEPILSTEANRTPPLLDTLGVLRMRLGRPGAGELFAEAEQRCLAARSAPGTGGERDGAGRTECPDDVLREIREHRADLGERNRSPASPALIQ